MRRGFALVLALVVGALVVVQRGSAQGTSNAALRAEEVFRAPAADNWREREDARVVVDEVASSGAAAARVQPGGTLALVRDAPIALKPTDAAVLAFALKVPPDFPRAADVFVTISASDNVQGGCAWPLAALCRSEGSECQMGDRGWMLIQAPVNTFGAFPAIESLSFHARADAGGPGGDPAKTTFHVDDVMLLVPARVAQSRPKPPPGPDRGTPHVRWPKREETLGVSCEEIMKSLPVHIPACAEGGNSYRAIPRCCAAVSDFYEAGCFCDETTLALLGGEVPYKRLHAASRVFCGTDITAEGPTDGACAVGQAVLDGASNTIERGAVSIAAAVAKRARGARASAASWAEPPEVTAMSGPPARARCNLPPPPDMLDAVAADATAPPPPPPPAAAPAAPAPLFQRPGGAPAPPTPSPQRQGAPPRIPAALQSLIPDRPAGGDEVSERFANKEGGLGMQDGMVKIVTFNMQDHNAFALRKGEIARLMQYSGADFIGTQECEHARCADQLVQTYPRYQYVRYPPIFYDSELWVVDPEQNGAFMLSDTPDVVGSNTWGFRWPRAVGWARFVPKNNPAGPGVYVYNTHFCCCGCTERAQVKSAMLITRHMADNRDHPDDPVVLTGDFNAAETGQAITYLKGKGSAESPVALADTFRVLHPQKSGNTGHFFKIDYVLVQPEVEVVAARIAPAPHSDHYPVSAVVRFPVAR